MTNKKQLQRIAVRARARAHEAKPGCSSCGGARCSCPVVIDSDHCEEPVCVTPGDVKSITIDCANQLGLVNENEAQLIAEAAVQAGLTTEAEIKQFVIDCSLTSDQVRAIVSEYLLSNGLGLNSEAVKGIFDICIASVEIPDAVSDQHITALIIQTILADPSIQAYIKNTVESCLPEPIDFKESFLQCLLDNPQGMTEAQVTLLFNQLIEGVVPSDEYIKELFCQYLAQYDITPECIKDYVRDCILASLPDQVSSEDVKCLIENHYSDQLHTKEQIHILFLEFLNQMPGKLWSESEIKALIDSCVRTDAQLKLFVQGCVEVPSQQLIEQIATVVATNLINENQAQPLTDEYLKAFFVDCLKDLPLDFGGVEVVDVETTCTNNQLVTSVSVNGISGSSITDLSKLDIPAGSVVSCDNSVGGQTSLLVDGSVICVIPHGSDTDLSCIDNSDNLLLFANGTLLCSIPKGNDGFSPAVTIVKTNGVTTVTVTDAQGTQSVQILDGVDGVGEAGAAGTVVTCDQSVPNQTSVLLDGVVSCVIPHGGNGGGSTIACRDNGPSVTLLIDNVEACTIPKGSDGEDGVSPTWNIQSTASGTQVTLTDVNGPQTFFVTNGTAGTPGTVVTCDSSVAGQTTILLDGVPTCTIQDGQDGISPVLACQDNPDSVDVLINGAVACTILKGTQGTQVTCQTVNGVTTIYGDGIALCSINGGSGIEVGGGTAAANADGSFSFTLTDTAGTQTAVTIPPRGLNKAEVQQCISDALSELRVACLTSATGFSAQIVDAQNAVVAPASQACAWPIEVVTQADPALPCKQQTVITFNGVEHPVAVFDGSCCLKFCVVYEVETTETITFDTASGYTWAWTGDASGSLSTNASGSLVQTFAPGSYQFEVCQNNACEEALPPSFSSALPTSKHDCNC